MAHSLAFVSLRYRPRCAFLILFFCVLYLFLSRFVLRGNLDSLTDASSAFGSIPIETIPEINQVVLEEKKSNPRQEIFFQHPTRLFDNPNEIVPFNNLIEFELPTTVAQTYPKRNSDSKGIIKDWTNKEANGIHLKTKIAPEHQLNPNGIYKFKPKMEEKYVQKARPTKNPAFIIDTPGCRIPKFDPWDPSILHFIEVLDPLICSDRPMFMSPQPNGMVRLNVSVLEKYYNATPDEMRCIYMAVGREYLPTKIREDSIYLNDERNLVFDTLIEDDHIAVKCYFNDDSSFEQYMPLVRLKEHVEEEKSNISPPTPLNVILIGIDSVSKLNFFRHFRQTQVFLKDKMNAFDMKGYTKVADNTFPNIVPMLTGHFVDYFWNESLADTFFFDNISLIWKDYARHGYRTFFADDAPFNGIFNYFKRGFFKEPTDYYYRTTALMIEKSTLKKEAKRINSSCLNSELETDIMNNYLLNFVKTMGNRPYFAFSMVSSLTHDFENYASYADAPTVKLLSSLNDEGALNNTILVMFSDHGIRYGSLRSTYIGKFEERMPFMYIHIPKWFLKQHPNIERNMIINQDRLITLFDIHATLKHLLYLNGETLMEKTDEIGLSLFREIPESRTCDDANIFIHWCPCTLFTPATTSDPAVINSANAIVNHINELLLQYAEKCETLRLQEIKDARLGLANPLVLAMIGHRGLVENAQIALGEPPPTNGDYLITLITEPGNAMFEGTVRYDEKQNIAKVLDISRINMYGTQSWCIDSPRLKLFCYCKTQPI